MSGFEFRYEQVMKLRIDQEKSVKDELARCVQQLLTLEIHLKNATKDKHAFYHHVDSRMIEGVDAAELQSFEGNKSHLKTAIIKLEGLIQKKHAEIEVVRSKLLKATMEKKKLEKLKEKELIIFKKEEQIADDKLNDQIVTFNSSLKRR